MNNFPEAVFNTKTRRKKQQAQSATLSLFLVFTVLNREK
jgi:hypothetical protein